MCGPLNDTIPVKRQTRYKYSPVHQDVAVCCIPNAGRIAPYYVRSMWMRDRDGLVAALYGPSVLETSVRNQMVKIEEVTDYPNNYTIRFKFTLDNPLKFTVKFRIPAWAKGVSLNLPHTDKGNYILVTKTWQNGEEAVLEFTPEIELRHDFKKQAYYTYGPLVLAHPVEGKQSITKEFSLPGFHDISVVAKEKIEFRYDPTGKVRLTDPEKLLLMADLINPKTNQTEPVDLVPMGGTILRQVTFKEK